MRTGVLSDASVRLHCVEFTPVSVGSNILHKSKQIKNTLLPGVKPERDTAFITSNYPIDYIQNLSLAIDPSEAANVVNQAVDEYRAGVRHILGGDDESVVESKRRDGYDDDVANMASLVGSMNLASYTRQLGSRLFNSRFPQYSGVVDVQTKAALMNLLDKDGDDQMESMLDIVTRGSKTKVSGSTAREQLKHAFHDDEDAVDKIDAAFDASKTSGYVPQ